MWSRFSPFWLSLHCSTWGCLITIQSKKFSLWITPCLYWSTFVGGRLKNSPMLHCSCHTFCICCGMARCISIPNACRFSICLMNQMQTTTEILKKDRSFITTTKGFMSCLWLTLWKQSNNHFCQTRRVSKLILTWHGSCWLAGGWFISPPWFLERSRNCSIWAVPNSKLFCCPIST